MVLPGYALISQGTQVHVAAWPGRELAKAPSAPNPLWARQLLLSRAFASQSGSYVIAASGMRLQEHVPERYQKLHTYDHTGESYIIDPRGEIIAGPAEGETILTAKGSLEAVYAAKAACDVGGHYSRPDIFQLHVNRRPITRVIDEETRSALNDRSVADDSLDGAFDKYLSDSDSGQRDRRETLQE